MPILETQEDFNFKLFINTRKHLLLAVALIWGTLILIFFAAKPQLQALFNIRDKLNVSRQELKELTKKVTELKQIKVSQDFENKEKVDEILPSHKPLLTLLFNLNQAAQQEEIQIDSLRISPGLIPDKNDEETTSTAIQEKAKETASSMSYSQLELELAISGTGQGVDNFFKTIEQMAPFSSITELEINNNFKPSNNFATDDREDEKKQQDRKVSADLILHSFYYIGTVKTEVGSTLPSVGDEEMEVFNTIQKFRPSEFEQPTDIKTGDVEDLFGIEGFDFEL